MKVLFLGVGEAFDEAEPNNSHIVLSDTRILLDCGYSVPHQLWKYSPDQSFLDAIYVSHSHADHYFGIPALVMRMWEEKRRKPLTIICPKGIEQTIRQSIEIGYPGFSDKFEFKIKYVEAEEKKTIRLNELELQFAPTMHSAKNLAVRVSDGKNTLCYSGDGMFNEKTERLYRDSGLLIHEAYLIREQKAGHACIKELIEMARQNNVKCLALTHIQRDVRKKEIEKIREDISGESIRVIVPEPMDEYCF